MGAVLPLHALIIHQSHVGFVCQRRGLEAVSRALTFHMAASQAAKLVINDRGQFFQRALVTVSPGTEERTYLTHFRWAGLYRFLHRLWVGLYRHARAQDAKGAGWALKGNPFGFSLSAEKLLLLGVAELVGPATAGAWCGARRRSVRHFIGVALAVLRQGPDIVPYRAVRLGGVHGEDVPLHFSDLRGASPKTFVHRRGAAVGRVLANHDRFRPAVAAGDMLGHHDHFAIEC